MEPEIREMRDMLIEVRRDMLHITQRLDDLSARHEARVGRIENDQQRFEERLRRLETKTYAMSAVISAGITALPYIVDALKGGH